MRLICSALCRRSSSEGRSEVQLLSIASRGVGANERIYGKWSDRCGRGPKYSTRINSPKMLPVSSTRYK